MSDMSLIRENKYSGIIIIVSVIANLVLASLSSYYYFHSIDQSDQIDDLIMEINELTESVNTQEQQNNILNTQLKYYFDLASNWLNQSNSKNNDSTILGYAQVPIVAIQTIQSGFNVEYEGVVMGCELELQTGSGRVLIDTIPMIGIDVQSSVRTATKVIENLTGLSFSSTDVVLTITGTEEVDVVDGGSAGAAITVALLSAVMKQDLNKSVYMTGTINSDGTIGEIGGAVYKALAVAELGASTFLVPKGQEIVEVYQQKTIEFHGRTRVIYEKVSVSLEEYLSEKGYSVEIIGVDTIESAYDIFSI